MVTEGFRGKILSDDLGLKKKGRTFSVNVCLKVCKCVFCRGSENDSCPLSKSRCTLSVWRVCSKSCTGPVEYDPYPTHLTLSHEKVSPLPLVGLCGHTHTPVCTVSNFNIPVVWPWVEALRAQDKGRVNKSFWIIRECLSRICLFKAGQILRNDERWVCSVWVQQYRSWTERWGEGEQMDSGVWLLLLLDGWFLLRHLAVTLIFKLML